MYKYIIVAAVCFSSAISFAEGIKCYHCYDSFNKSIVFGDAYSDSEYGSQFVRCEKNQNNWNSWDCPAKWPVCIIMTGKVKDHYEIVRTCAEKGFCSKYVPPADVRLDSCRECNTTLCNDYPRIPDPPSPGPLFNFNININLNIKKYPVLSDDSEQ